MSPNFAQSPACPFCEEGERGGEREGESERETEKEREREKEEARYTKEEIYVHISERENERKRGMRKH